MNQHVPRSDDAVFRRYLLGSLSDTEREAVEERIFTQNDCVEQLALVEDDLIDEYVRGELSPDENRLFQSHFLSSPRHSERVAFARTWLTASPQNAQPIAARKWRIPALSDMFQWSFAPALAAACAVLLLTGAFLLPFYARLSRQSAELAGLRAELARKSAAPRAPDTAELLAELRKELAAPGPIAPSVPASTFVLSPGLTRGDARSAQRLSLPAGRFPVELRLTLTSGNYPRYRVVIEDSAGAQVWGREQLRAAGPGAPPELKLTIPSTVLKPGEYRISLAGVTASGEREELEDYYVFSVLAR